MKVRKLARDLERYDLVEFGGQRMMVEGTEPHPKGSLFISLVTVAKHQAPGVGPRGVHLAITIEIQPTFELIVEIDGNGVTAEDVQRGAAAIQAVRRGGAR